MAMTLRLTDTEQMLVGDSRDVAVGLEFPDADAARAWLDDPEYAKVAGIRLASTTGSHSFIVELLP